MNRPPDLLTPALFVDSFAEGWLLPKPGEFLDHFRPLMHPAVTLTQPLFPEAHGIEGFNTLFTRMFSLFLDLTVTVQRSITDDRTAVIESAVTTRLGRKTLHADVCDRFTIEDGLVIQRHSYFDPTPLLFATVRSPTAWPRVARSFRPLPRSDEARRP
jgi:limonene-1,2-epoxide hydrolase